MAISWFLYRNSDGQKGVARYIQILKGNNLHPGILYPTRLSFKIKNFSDKQKLKEYSNTKPNLKEILKRLL